MKKAIGCSAQLVFLLAIAALLAVPLACFAATTAPLHSPKLAGQFICPPDTTLVTEWYQATWNEPGEKTLAAYCVDAQGNESPTLPQDSKMLWKGTTVYFPYLFIPLLILGALVVSVLNALGIAIGRLLKKTVSPE